MGRKTDAVFRVGWTAPHTSNGNLEVLALGRRVDPRPDAMIHIGWSACNFRRRVIFKHGDFIFVIACPRNRI